MKRLYRSAVSLLIVLAVYWAYALAAVPLIEPSAPPPRPGPKGPHLGDYRLGQLAKLFPPGAWERQDPILIEIERGKLLLQKYDNNRPDGKVEISPLTVVVLPDKPAENEEQLYRQAVILKAPRALLQFDSPVELGSMKIGRLIGGQLVGEVTIHSAGAKPGTDDDLWIVTRDVQLSEKEVQTDQPVAFRWGKSFGRGSGMRIRLKPGPPATGGALSGPTASGIEQFELQRIERLHIDVPPPAAPQTARAGPAPVAAPPRLPQALGGRSLEITCRGPFCFRQSDWSASFHDHVEVRQINPQGPADQLLGDRLTLYFAPRAAGVDPATASPGDMELGRVEAWGKPVLVNAPSRPATAQGDHLVFHLRENRVVLESKLEVFLKQESQEIHARRIDYQSLEEPLLGKAVAQGPGWLRGSDPNRPNEFLTAKWQGQLQLAPEGNRQKIALMDGAELNYSRMGCLKAREICFWLAEAPSADRSQKPEWRPERMEAKTNVEIQSPDLSGSVEQLVVTFESKVAPSVYQTTPLSRSTFGRYPEKGGSEGGFDDNLVVCPFRLYQLGATAGSSSSAGNTVGQSNRGTRKLNLDRPLESSDGILPNRPHPNPLPKGEGTHPPSGLVYTAFYQAAPEASAAPPQQHFHVTGRTMHARVQMTEQRQGELAELTIEGNVCCRETQTLQPDERPLTITGDRLHVTDASGPRTVATVTGQPARCEGRGWTVISANVNLSYGENRVWIEGPGKMILPQDAAVAGPMVPSGRTSGTTGPVTITWQGGMHFDGRSANFTRSVVASTPSRWLQCEALEAQLDRPIRFKDPHLQNQPQPEAEKLFCRGGVWMENRDGDSAGWLTGLDRMHAVELNLDAKTGALAAAGPGWINSVRQGRNQPLQFSLAGTAAPPSAATADPNQRYCLNVQFQGSIAGNLSEGQRHLAFYHDVRGVYAPVASWETTLTPDAPEGLPPEGISLECDRLAVDQRADPQGGPDAIELIAEGNTVVQDKYFTARALRITYAKAKELLILEGDGRTDAWLGYQKQVGGETSEVAARQIWYWKDTGRINIIDARSAEVNQFAPPGK